MNTYDANRHCAMVALLSAPEVNVGEWHSQKVDHPLLVTKELLDVAIEFTPCDTVSALQHQIKPNLPWAEEHFEERVGRVPLNPPPSHKIWPWAHKQHQTIEGEKFSHTYPERYWPKHAGHWLHTCEDEEWEDGRVGIRFEYGDLDDVVAMLRRNGNTRQAYLPVWFPEDTGAVHGERVPCSLGYHFLVREGKLSVRYYLRSCDFVRHFDDDMYLTSRLLLWVRQQLPGVMVGKVIAYISSLHIMKGDEAKLRQELENGDSER
jgi:thymidylate synthase